MADASIENAGLVIVDKSAGITSHDVVSQCRKIFGTRRVGHAGTLDPMATGVLVVGIERATKLLGLLSLNTKSYTATIRLGAATDTDDREGQIIGRGDVATVTDETIAAAVADLTGDISQVPARVSAIKVDGRRAHALARTGAEFDLAARPVTVSRFEIRATHRADDDSGEARFLDLDVEVDCSSGTYIRSLARDLGDALGTGGHLTALRRTSVGPFILTHARTLEELAEAPELSLTIDQAALLSFPRRDIDDDEAESISQGRWLVPLGNKGIHVAVDPRGQAIALIDERGRRASSVMVVRPATLR
ncbi:tRNA pseudouridine(55) synthase TruB [Gordonia sp. DT30]|uniref:tRNA pseudouridine(55) synthase TruB n=1 Tax=Gordonia sp. DT30 TaxID=3416546 RepID=UPI003CE94FA6